MATTTSNLNLTGGIDVDKVWSTDEEKWHLIKINLKCESNVQYEYMVDKQGEEIWAAECWDADKCKIWKDAEEEKRKRKEAESGRAKQFKRYMKKHGAGRMTFNENDDGDWAD